MQISTVKTIVTTLTLNEKERIWLHSYMQNSHLENEDTTTTKMRNTFFTATDENPPNLLGEL